MNLTTRSADAGRDGDAKRRNSCCCVMSTYLAIKEYLSGSPAAVDGHDRAPRAYKIISHHVENLSEPGATETLTEEDFKFKGHSTIHVCKIYIIYRSTERKRPVAETLNASIGATFIAWR